MLLALLAVLSTPSSDSLPVYHGREQALRVVVPRFETEVVVDGVLGESAWAGAAILTGFSHFQPIDGVAAEDSTEVRVWYSPTAIHFGIRAFEPHGQVSATLADRDRIFSDDVIQLLIGTFNDGRQAFLFAVNPLGVQADGALVERGAAAVGGFGGGGAQARENADLSPDYVFQSKGRLVEGGYEIEVRIPFKSLRYQARAEQVWQLHVLRQIQHAGYEDSWVPAQRAAGSFLAQAGTLSGLRDLERGLALDFTPEVTSRLDGARTGAGGWTYDRAGPELGGTVRWGVTNNLSLNGTANPDFSQVEADVSQIQFDPRDELFFPEKRPFFLDGLELFSAPSNLVYTRRIVQPVAAVKLTGKALGTDLGFISAVDDQVASVPGDEHPVANMLRVQKDVGARSRLGLVYTDRIDGEHWNRVGALDGRLVFGKSNFTFQLGASRTHEFGQTISGPLWQARFNHSGRRFGVRYTFAGIDPDFRTRSGFIGRTGDVNLNLVTFLTFTGKPGSLVENFTPDVSLLGTWTYDRFMDGQGVRDPKLHLNLNTTLRGGWQAGFSLLVETFGYDPRIYTNYALEVPGPGGIGLDTVPFTGGNQRIPNRDYVFSFATPTWRTFSANAFALIGQDENFFEWASAEIIISDFGVLWRPTDQLRIEGRYRQNQYKRRDDRSLVGRQRIPRLKVEYQIARPLFIRLVGEYNSSERDSLRDHGRTEAPILIFNPRTGEYERAGASSNNAFRGDVLISFAPVPGTVFFAGYGSILQESEPFQFERFRRRNDGFFLKGSYLFRLGG
jgi:hypothetical protein